MKPEAAFLQAIRESPDDDTPRLVFADWLSERGNVRGEFIRVQCELARMAEDDPGRPALAEREKELLAAHQREWLDLAFVDWLRHRKRDCRNPKGHEFCKLVAHGVRTQWDHDRLPEGNPQRKQLKKRLDQLGERMDEEFDYLPATCTASVFEYPEFRRGFLERVQVQDWAVILYADALADLEVVRELEIENDAVAAVGDAAFQRLIPVLGRLSLRVLDSHSEFSSLETVQQFVASPGVRSLTTLSIWFDHDVGSDEAVRAVADSPQFESLRTLELEHSRTFTDAALEAILHSPHLRGLTRCVLTPNEQWEIGPAVLRRWRERFGKAPDDRR
jgi:uncharacterized protein (TIGR02996 family)